MFCEPLRGYRHVRVTERRTKVGWAHALRDFLNEFYAEAEKIVLVMDNLNTHSPGSFYEAFAPDVARQLTERLQIHYTPKHGSWLNIAECEFSVLQRQCLNRRIDSAEFLGHEVNAWQASRNAIDSQINWQFTTGDARVKLRRLYPEYLRRDTDHHRPHRHRSATSKLNVDRPLEKSKLRAEAVTTRPHRRHCRLIAAYCEIFFVG
jgi:hypothetical protein